MKRYLITLLTVLLSTGMLFSLTGFGESPIFEISDETLPVTLSSFMAIPNVDNQSISIHWETQSESNLIGYHIHRAETANLESAVNVNGNIIPALNSPLVNNYDFNDDEVEDRTTYYYWLHGIEFTSSDFYGPITVSTDFSDEDNNIEDLLLGNNFYSNYPNPFNPSTTISFSLAEPTDVIIEIFNIKGQKIKSLYSAYVSETNIIHNIVWNGDDSLGNTVSTGIYFAKIKAGSFIKTRKMLLSK